MGHFLRFRKKNGAAHPSVKDLEETAFMQDGELPPPTEHKRVAIHREDLNDRLLAPLQGLAHLDDLLADVIGLQRTSFGKASSKACPADDQGDDIDAPPDSDEDNADRPTVTEEDDPKARFAPSDSWRRPSDYVALMAKRFEDDWTSPRTKKKEPRPLKRDQVFFVAQFAQACNTVWEESRRVEKNELDASKITCFNILLMG